MRTRSLPSSLLLALLATLGTSCILISSCAIVSADGESWETHAGHHADHDGPAARARIEGRSGVRLSGQATFHEVEGGVLITLRVDQAPPGWHAVHVHETGDCSAEDGTSSGGHFNPGGTQHGSPHAAEHHAGDLGNMWVGEDGTGHHAILMPELTVAAGDYSVVGRAIVVHAGADDLVSQPTGAAGGRIGCGVIQ